MIYLNHHGWSIDFCGDSYCWEKDKKINISIIQQMVFIL